MERYWTDPRDGTRWQIEAVPQMRAIAPGEATPMIGETPYTLQFASAPHNYRIIVDPDTGGRLDGLSDEDLIELLGRASGVMRRKAPAGAPRPLEAHLRLLDEAIDILEANDPVTEALPELRRALERLDRLLDELHNIDPNSYPPGFQERIVGARFELAAREPQEALGRLRALRNELGRYWT